MPPGGLMMEEATPGALGYPGPIGAPEAWAAGCRERLLLSKATSVASLLSLVWNHMLLPCGSAGMAEAPGARPLQPRKALCKSPSFVLLYKVFHSQGVLYGRQLQAQSSLLSEYLRNQWKKPLWELEQVLIPL